MADEKHLQILREALEKKDISIWNQWRGDNPDLRPNLAEADLTEASLNNADLSQADLAKATLFFAHLNKADLTGANLSGADLNGATLYEARLVGANMYGIYLFEAGLSGADLSGAILTGAILSDARIVGAGLSGADLSGAVLSRSVLSGTNLSEATLEWTVLEEADLSGVNLARANLSGATLARANLSGAHLNGTNLVGADLGGAFLYEARLNGADLTGASLHGASLVRTDFTNATLEGCSIYGISAWDIELEGATQKNLNISPDTSSPITVDNLKVAQFIYLMLNNTEIRDVLETITTKAVLILGRFTDASLKATLDAMRDKLRDLNYVPIVFDFQRLSGQDYTETIKLLAGMCKFVIADLTQARSIQQELQAIVPDFEIPIVPIIQYNEQIIDGQKIVDRPYSMIENHLRQDHVLDIFQYQDTDDLISKFKGIIINRAEQKYNEIIVKKAKHEIRVHSSDTIPLDNE